MSITLTRQGRVLTTHCDCGRLISTVARRGSHIAIATSCRSCEGMNQLLRHRKRIGDVRKYATQPVATATVEPTRKIVKRKKEGKQPQSLITFFALGSLLNVE